jgi:hypothetical protein
MSKHTFLRRAIATMATLIATGVPVISSAHAVDSAPMRQRARPPRSDGRELPPITRS